ncbi:MAG TPA: Ig-like domain-containing protein, partial [Archangium sp.]
MGFSALVTARKPGQTTLTAKADSVTATATIGVPQPIVSLAISPTSATIFPGDTVHLAVTATDAAGSTAQRPAYGWSASDSSKVGLVASNTQSNIVTALAAGTADVTASTGQLRATARFTIRPAIASVEVTPGGATLTAGSSRGYTAIVRDAEGNDIPGLAVTWASSDLSVLTITQQGTVTARAAGSARVLATVRGKTGSATVTVTGASPTVSTWRELSAGATHSCGIDTANRLYCWGANEEGQLGDGTHDASSVPRLVAGGRTYTHVSVGTSRSCATATGGDTYCWGAMYQATSDVPARVNAPSPLTGLSLANTFACALTEAGEPLCWGEGTRSGSRDPRAVPATGSFIAVTGARDGGCGLRSSGTVLCWVGTGFTSYELASGTMETLDGSASGGFVCGRASGVVNCTHTTTSGGPGGQLLYRGLGPLPGGASGVKQVSAGGGRVCALDQAGAAYCWTRRPGVSAGSDLSFVFDPGVRVAEGFTFTQLTVGDTHVCGIATSGQGFCWG